MSSLLICSSWDNKRSSDCFDLFDIVETLLRTQRCALVPNWDLFGIHRHSQPQTYRAPGRALPGPGLTEVYKPGRNEEEIPDAG